MGHEPTNPSGNFFAFTSHSRPRWDRWRSAALLVEAGQRGGDLMGDLAVERQGEMSHTADPDVTYGEVRVADPSPALRHDQLVEVAVEGQEPGVATRCRLGQLSHQVTVRPDLLDQWPGQQPRGRGALVRCPEGHASVHPLMSAEPLHVVPGDQAAQTVPDQVDPVGAG